MNIYVANLSWNTNSDSLQELFSQYGEVTSAYIINDRDGTFTRFRLRRNAE
ncbi:MAG: hypothetical protein V8S11_06050 [Flavonifractor plautii]